MGHSRPHRKPNFDGKRFASSMKDAEIAALTIDGGLGYRGQPDLHIPRLTTVLDQLQRHHGLLMLDVKDGPNAHRIVAELAANWLGEVWLSCYSVADCRAVPSSLTTYGASGQAPT